MPPVLIWAIGTIGAAVVAKVATREWRRVNADLDRRRTAPVTETEHAPLPTLRRDPTTGVYRP
jgi:hypothetical protein